MYKSAKDGPVEEAGAIAGFERYPALAVDLLDLAEQHFDRRQDFGLEAGIATQEQMEPSN